MKAESQRDEQGTPPMIVERLARLASSLVPDAFSIAVLLTFATLLAAVTWAGASPGAALRAWGGGMWALLPLSMQIAFVVFGGYLLAVSPPVARAIDFIARLPRTGAQAVGLAAFTSMGISWLNWGVGLVASAILVKSIAARRRDVNYPLLVAAGYLGMGVTWHAGPSGTVPLLFAGRDSFMVRDGLLAAPIALGETIFSSSNLFFTSLAALLLGLAAVLLARLSGAIAPPPDLAPTADADAVSRPAAPSPAERLSHSRVPTFALGLLGVAFLAVEGFAGRFSLSLDTVNLIVLFLALLFHRNAAALLSHVEEAAKPLHGIVLQFPLYAGMYGVIKDTGLANRLAEVFLSVATPATLPDVVFAYSAFLNYWVPSGGAKWAMEAPYILKSAAALSVSPATIAMAYSYGDMATNLIQPFWAIPLLGVAKLEFKHILGYELVFFAIYSVLAVAALRLF
ncbi:MAG: TIGR00366 family protein [Vicinamibacteria bacterium]